LTWRVARPDVETLQEDDDMQHSFFLPETEKLYAEWEQEVRKDGRDEGYKDGRDEGYKDGERALLARQLASRFGELPAGVRQRIDAAEREDIERWALRVLDAATLDEVFAG
jgi:flagellar biosynthesis/type III secretory pathway protein FliH